VAVTVDVDTSKRVTQSIEHDDAQPKTETSNSTETSTGSPATEPGVQANLGQAVSKATLGQSNTTEETTVENFEPKLSKTETIEQMPFATRSVTAAIGIPRSFIASVFKARFPDKGEPKDDQPEYAAIRDEQTARVKQSVERIVMAKKPSDVVVDVYPDMEWSSQGGSWNRTPGAVAATADMEPFDTLGMVRLYGPQAGLGLLALTSLMMMVRIVKRTGPANGANWASALEGEAASEPEPILNADAHAVGQAGVSESLLTGRELDDRTLRYQELSREVSKLVQEDPEGTAELIKRWISE